MKTENDIENYMLKSSLSFEEIDKGTWIVKEENSGLGNLIVKLDDPILLFRIKVMGLPEKNKEDLYKFLLELNTKEMLHGSYGIEAESIVLSAALQIENLDHNEFQAVIDDLSLAMNKHLPKLNKYLS